MIAVAIAAEGDQFDCCRHDPCIRTDGYTSWDLPDGTRSTVCPITLLDPFAVDLLGWFGHYMDGRLPAAGGMLDQSAFFMDMIRVVKKWKAKHGGG